MRKVTNVSPTELTEHINEYSYHDTGVVRVGVVQGYNINGVFQPLPGQTAQFYQIMYEDFQELMAGTDTKPQGQFRRDDLWPFIDRCRQGKDALTVRQTAQAMAAQGNTQNVNAQQFNR